VANRYFHFYYTLYFSVTSWVSQYQKGRTILNFNEARDDDDDSDVSNS